MVKKDKIETKKHKIKITSGLPAKVPVCIAMCEQGSGRWRWIWTGGILGQGTTPENLSVSFFQYFVECLLVLIIYVNKVDLWPDTLLKWENDEGYLVFILKTEWKVPCWIRREKRWEPQFFRQLERILRRERKDYNSMSDKKDLREVYLLTGRGESL